MKTKIITIEDLTKEILNETFSNHHPIPFPTETVFGLGASFDDTQTILHIFKLKGRPLQNPLIVHISQLEMLDILAKDIPKDAYTLMDAFFPGPLTLILHKKESVSDLVTANQKTVAIRMPDSDIARAFIDKVGKPVVAPSANLSGKPSATTIEHVVEDFQFKIPYIINGTPSKYGIESTIIDLTSFPYTILRPGVITKSHMETILGFTIATEGSKVVAPGMHYPHYEPIHPLYILKGRDESIVAFVKKQTHALFIGHARFKEFMPEMIVMGHDEHEMKQKLYHVLRHTSTFENVTLYTHDILDEAYMNRLMKAAKDHIILV